MQSAEPDRGEPGERRARVETSAEVATALGEIAESVDRVTKLVAEIAAASTQQNQGIEQVNVSVAEMDRVTQQDVAVAEESASASEELAAQARELTQMMEVLIRTVRGTRAVRESDGPHTDDVRGSGGPPAPSRWGTMPSGGRWPPEGMSSRGR